MRKVTMSIVGAILIIGISSIAIFSASEKWQGKSEDGKWEVTYRPDDSPHDTWIGTLFWQGKDEIILQNIQFVSNGYSELGYTKNETIGETIRDKWTFADFSDKPNKDDNIYVLVKWDEDNNTYTKKN